MNNKDNKKVFVIGGAGFIGSHLVDKLVELGYAVVVLDNLSTGKNENINKKAKFYLCDVRDDVIAKIFAIEKPSIVYHLASQVSVPKSVENPQLDFRYKY